MRLHALLRQALPTLDLSGIADADITRVEDDSRRVRPGDVFVARPGVARDGAAFVRSAVDNGAAALITQTHFEGIAVPQVVVADAAAALSPLANIVCGRPSETLGVIGVTGTNGKTTTTYLIRHILNALGRRCGMFGTVEIDDGRLPVESTMTTPSAVDVATVLANMVNNQCVAAAVEVSSHALHQHRVSGVTFAGAGFTNLTGDHLDYHGTMDAYADAKAVLFVSLAADAVAAVNADSAFARRMTDRTAARVVTFGIAAAADYRATNVAVTAAGTTFTLTSPRGTADVRLKLVGRHNIENALCAITLCCECCDLDLTRVTNALADATGAPGRLQPVPTKHDFAVLVDYAHTDDALRNVLSALKPLTGGRLRVVFGCGGDRDRTKRPRMAAVAEEIADVLYVTSDNPRTENADAILAEIVAGLSPAGRSNAVVEVDRRTAIERAIADAGPGDVVLIAGKGHEKYQIVGTTKHAFDDVKEAARALATRPA